MGTIAVSINGRELLIWSGGQEDIVTMEKDLGGRIPSGCADTAVGRVVEKGGFTDMPELETMLIVYSVAMSPITFLGLYPGTIADRFDTHDFAVDLRRIDEGHVEVNYSASPIAVGMAS